MHVRLFALVFFFSSFGTQLERLTMEIRIVGHSLEIDRVLKEFSYQRDDLKSTLGTDIKGI
jgi:hypothetical protein